MSDYTEGQRIGPLSSEVHYWRNRADRFERMLAQFTSNFQSAAGGTPPEPPLGTVFRRNEDNGVSWRRLGAGWYCARTDCSSCPAQWDEVWDTSVSRNGFIRELPTEVEEP